MDVKKITKLYIEEIKHYHKNEDITPLLTRLQKSELYFTKKAEIEEMAEMYAMELIDCIDVLKSKGLL